LIDRCRSRRIGRADRTHWSTKSSPNPNFPCFFRWSHSAAAGRFKASCGSGQHGACQLKMSQSFNPRPGRGRQAGGVISRRVEFAVRLLVAAAGLRSRQRLQVFQRIGRQLLA
jgi:hypothetical protein